METASISAWSASGVFDRLLDREPLFLLDVRNEEEYANGRIEGTSFATLNVPYFDLLEDLGALAGKLPPEPQPVLVVCAKEGSSRYVAQRLVESGRTDVSVLAGGMGAWNAHVHVVRVGDLPSGGTLYQMVRVGKGCLSYVIASDGEAAVVDPARFAGPYEELARRHGLKIRHVLDTHLHADHISGGRTLAAKQGAAYWLPSSDAIDVTFPHRSLDGGTVLTVGRARLEILPTPGHTAGSQSIVVDGRYLLTGDTLFMESVGRPDLAGQSEELAGRLYDSLFHTYRALPDELVVLPAHFAQASELDSHGRVLARLGDLFQANQGLRVMDRKVFARTVTEHLPPQPHAFEAIRRVNMGALSPDDIEQAEMETGPNRCAVHG